MINAIIKFQDNKIVIHSEPKKIGLYISDSANGNFIFQSISCISLIYQCYYWFTKFGII